MNMIMDTRHCYSTDPSDEHGYGHQVPLQYGASDEHGYGHQAPLQYGASDEHGYGHQSPDALAANRVSG